MKFIVQVMYGHYIKKMMNFIILKDNYYLCLLGTWLFLCFLKLILKEYKEDIIHYLNDEVEIIKEDKEIEEIEPIKGCYDGNQLGIELVNKVNKLIIAVNELKKGK